MPGPSLAAAKAGVTHRPHLAHPTLAGMLNSTTVPERSFELASALVSAYLAHGLEAARAEAMRARILFSQSSSRQCGQPGEPEPAE